MIVVPMLAPMIMGVACIKVITPALTKPMTMTEVAEELWIIAVTPAPIPTPEKRLLLIRSRSRFIPIPALFSRAPLMKFIPTIKTPTPARSQIKLWINWVISAAVNIFFLLSTRSRNHIFFQVCLLKRISTLLPTVLAKVRIWLIIESATICLSEKLLSIYFGYYSTNNLIWLSLKFILQMKWLIQLQLCKNGVPAGDSVFVCSRSGILHNHRAHAFAGMLAGICTSLQALVNLPPGDGNQHIGSVLGQGPHGAQI